MAGLRQYGLPLSKIAIAKTLLFALILGVVLPLASGASQARKRLRSNINDSETFVLRGNTRPVVALGLAQDQGAVSGSQWMPRMSLHFTMTAAQRADLEQLLSAQQDRRSPQYRKFLTPEEYAARFGLNTADIEKVRVWLENNGFLNVQAARSRAFVSFSGTAAQAQAAFHTAIRQYSLNGVAHIANASDPQLPKPLEGIAESVRGLHDFGPRPHITRMQPHFTSGSGTTSLVPGDWETIYDVTPLYGSGLDGSPISGQNYSIVVVGQSNIQLSDLEAFRAAAQLPIKDPTVVIPPGDSDPGRVGGATGDEGESDLDLEWAGAIAKNANILFVTAASGVEAAIQYAIDNNVAPILSTSYGVCEADLAAGDFNTEETLFKNAAALGMTVVAPSGDAGASDCDTASGETVATKGLAVDYPASSEYVTGIGGTELSAEGTGTYWSSTNGSNGGSALSYIPEVAWNDGVQAVTGGGASSLVAKPSWQAGTGVPGDGHRDVPDIAFAASAKQNGLVVCSGGSCTSGFQNSSSAVVVIGGTSVGPPTFSGVLALLVQKTGARVGLLNPNLYSLAAISETVFHDVTAGNNDVNCQGGTPSCPAASGTGVIGYSAGIGYDQTTGWGSLDSYNFVEQWSGDIQLTASPASLNVQPGGSAAATITVTPTNNFSGPVSFACSVSSSLTNVTCSVPNTVVNTSGSTTVTITSANVAATPSVWRLFQGVPPAPPKWLLVALALAAAVYFLRKQRIVYARSFYTWSAAGFLILTLGAVSCGSGSSSAVFLNLSCSLPTFAQVTVPYSANCVASGGKAPFTYSISSGTLPPGLSLNSTTGIIAGTPTGTGASAFAVEVTDSESPAKTATQTIANFVVAPPIEHGTVTVTAKSGAIVNTTIIAVTTTL